MSWPERLVRALLRAAPRSFRERYADEYVETLRARMRAAEGGVATVWLGVKEVLGALRTVARLRVGLEASGEPSWETTRGGETMMLATIRHDTRQAARTLRRNPGFAIAAISVLALGIGANAAIFSAVNAFFFRPLPFQEPDRLVLLYETNPEFGWTDVSAAPANALDWRERVDAFSDLALYQDGGLGDVVIQTDGEPSVVRATAVSGNFFDVLGVRPHLGRSFTWAETWAPDDKVLVLSHGLWVTRFGADPDVIGRTIPFGGAGTPHEILGVMPEGFSFPHDGTDLWYTHAWDPASTTQVFFRRAHYLRPIARLAPGVTLEEADAQLQAVVRSLQEEYPETNRVMGAGLTPMREFLVRDARAPVLVLLGAVTLLLLLACANVANLMLVRANGRKREVALRHALGAGRRRVAIQLLTESLMLAGLGGALGLGLGSVGVRAMTEMTRIGISGATEIALDGRVVAFTIGVAALAGVLFGLVPALRSTSGDVHQALREGGRGQSGGPRANRATGLLVAAEVALALLLVVGAGLMVRSFVLMRDVDPGFRIDGALAVELSVPSSRYPNRDQVIAFWDQLADAVEGRPGIERAGMVAQLPLDGTSYSSQFQAEGWPPDRVGFEIVHRRADNGYFEALDIPLVRGRLFETSDGPDDPYVVVINEAFAREHFPGEDPIGQRIAFDRAATPESTWFEIVGIVGDQHQESPKLPARAEVFESRRQDWARGGWLVMKTSIEALDVVPAVRDALRDLDPQIPLSEVRPLREVWSASMNQERFVLTLLTVFGVSALLLATVGVYGVTAQAARRRTQEIGIRMALGAGAPDVLGMMLRQGLAVVGAGLVVGLLASLLATRALATLLYGVEPTDPGTLASVVALLGAVALLACYVPARRATSVDPVSSLRAE